MKGTSLVRFRYILDGRNKAQTYTDDETRVAGEQPYWFVKMRDDKKAPGCAVDKISLIVLVVMVVTTGTTRWRARLNLGT